MRSAGAARGGYHGRRNAADALRQPRDGQISPGEVVASLSGHYPIASAPPA